MAADQPDDEPLLPNMRLAQLRFLCGAPEAAGGDRAAARAELLAAIEEGQMHALYESTCAELGWPVDAALLARMREAAEAELAETRTAQAFAEENEGDQEVLAAMLKRAEILARVGDKAACVEAYEAVLEQKLSTQRRIDVVMAVIRVALFHGDRALARANVTKAKELVEAGGDWDHRNRLKVYEGLFLVSERDFAGASALLLPAAATYSAVEMADFETFTFHMVLTAIVTVDRVTLKRQVVDSPDVLGVIDNIPHLGALLNALYDCRYRDLMAAVVELHPALLRDRYVSAHTRFFLRELRVLAYRQFLQSYRSVTVESMARTFGVAPAFLDAELARFIAAGRLNAKIDKVAGIVETNRPDAKNAQYQAVIKQGDQLLNRVQKLARVTNG